MGRNINGRIRRIERKEVRMNRRLESTPVIGCITGSAMVGREGLE